jgi:anti-sigma factor RsiW
MSQNQEIIEAKLCAFIDGELDAEGRVEIEKHLEANPQHRRLLESLKATRDLIKWLPREAAPPEVAETLNGQLERSVLLDSESEFLRPSIWPRVMAAAAIVVLTAGLGLAVYFTLPKSQKNATPFAVRSQDTPAVEAQTEEKTDEAAGRREPVAAGVSKGGLSAMKAAKGGGNEAEANKSELAKSDEELKQWANQVGQNRDALNAVVNGARNTAAAQSGPITSNAVVMLVRSNAPQATRLQVTNFLDAQKIQWTEAAAPADNAQVQNAFNFAYDGRQRRQQSEGVSQTSPLVQQQQIQQQVQNAPTTAMAKNNGDALLQNSTTQPATPGVANGLTDRLAVQQRLYVARMSRQQAVSLSNSMAQEAQSTQLKDLSGATVTLAELGAGKQPVPFGMVNTAAATEPADVSQNASASYRSVQRLSGQAPAGFGGGTVPAQPTTQSTDQRQQMPAAVLVPGTQVVGESPASATQPATTQLATTQPADEAVDVVIVVESEAGQPAPAPTTQPTQPSPTTQPASGQ